METYHGGGRGAKRKRRFRIYGHLVEIAAGKHLKRFMLDPYSFIVLYTAVRTDRWGGYQGPEGKFPNLVREKSEKKEKNLPQLQKTVMFKAWLRGIHSFSRLQPYIHEYTYRFNRHKMKERNFENLMKRMVEKPAYPYKDLYLSYP